MPSACQIVVDFIGLFDVRVERTFATKNWHFENLSLMAEIFRTLGHKMLSLQLIAQLIYPNDLWQIKIIKYEYWSVFSG